MMRNLYYEVPYWWWGTIVIICWVVALACLYVMKSTLPWWGFVLSTILTTIFLLFFGAQYGITGFQFNIQPICQMLAGYLFPGKPLASKAPCNVHIFHKLIDPRPLFHLLHFQCHADGPVTRTRSQTGPVCPFISKEYFYYPSPRMFGRRHHELCDDDNVSLGHWIKRITS
jgi:hypothetical protein